MTWNIRQGGGRRVPAILQELERLRPDVAVITEFRNNESGDALRGGLLDLGLQHETSPDTAPRINTVLVASRVPIETEGLAGTLADRVVRARLPDLTLLAAYFPAQKKEIPPFFEELLPVLDDLSEAPAALVGDFNTGVNHIDCQGTIFAGHRYLESVLPERGWTDAWREINGDAREFSWYSSKGNGFRIDHAFVTEALSPRVQSARYAREVRRPGLSDHSALVVEFS